MRLTVPPFHNVGYREEHFLFRFCPPFVHENFEVDILLNFYAECCIKWNGLDSVTKTEVFA